MQQAHALAALLKGLRAGLPDISIGMFTGYSPRELEEGRFWTRQESDKEERIHFWLVDPETPGLRRHRPIQPIAAVDGPAVHQQKSKASHL